MRCTQILLTDWPSFKYDNAAMDDSTLEMLVDVAQREGLKTAEEIAAFVMRWSALLLQFETQDPRMTRPAVTFR